MEIERKFIVKEMPENLDSFTKKEIVQGYLCNKPVLRIRKSNSDYIFTYKQKKEMEHENDPIVNVEIEEALSEDAFYHLLEKVDGNPISKTRYIIPYSVNGADYRIELDVFHGKLDGLCFAEVEFESVQASEKFIKPSWFGADVSNDRRYRNHFLSLQENLDCFK